MTKISMDKSKKDALEELRQIYGVLLEMAKECPNRQLADDLLPIACLVANVVDRLEMAKKVKIQ